MVDFQCIFHAEHDAVVRDQFLFSSTDSHVIKWNSDSDISETSLFFSLLGCVIS